MLQASGCPSAQWGQTLGVWLQSVRIGLGGRGRRVGSRRMVQVPSGQEGSHPFQTQLFNSNYISIKMQISTNTQKGGLVVMETGI